MRDRRVAWHKAEVCYTGPGWRPTSGAWRGVGRHAAATEPVQHVVRAACTAVLRVALRAQVQKPLRVLDRLAVAGVEPVLSPNDDLCFEEIGGGACRESVSRLG